MKQKADEFAWVELQPAQPLTDSQKEIIPLLLKAGKIMDKLFWIQAYGKDYKTLDTTDADIEALININYGPWERLNNNLPLLPNYGKKPAGAAFYPQDMTKEEFVALEDSTKTSQYTMIIRNAEGKLQAVPYHQYFHADLADAANYIRQAAQKVSNPLLQSYLNARASALLTDDYFESDMLWMDVKNNDIDFIAGPIENYEDGLFGYKTAYESFILLKDQEWTSKLEHINALMPALQQSLPCPLQYKPLITTALSDMGVYDALFYGGDCNAGSKTIAINLPNDERVQTEKGSRKLQLKNSMRAKFDKILMPIAQLLIDSSQIGHVNFNAFFENVMMHEVAHGLGVKWTNDGATIRSALKECYSTIEEAKADILGLYLVNQLMTMKELPQKDRLQNYVTFVAGIFRSVRFGLSSAHGKANMFVFNTLLEQGAVSKTKEGFYLVNAEQMDKTVAFIGEKVLTIEGTGNYQEAGDIVKNQCVIKEELQKDLHKIATSHIPKDIRFTFAIDNLDK